MSYSLALCIYFLHCSLAQNPDMGPQPNTVKSGSNKSPLTSIGMHTTDSKKSPLTSIDMHTIDSNKFNDFSWPHQKTIVVLLLIIKTINMSIRCLGALGRPTDIPCDGFQHHVHCFWRRVTKHARHDAALDTCRTYTISI